MQYAISFNSIYCDLLCSNVLEKLFLFLLFSCPIFHKSWSGLFFNFAKKRKGGGGGSGGESGEEREGSAEIIREM